MIKLQSGVAEAEVETGKPSLIVVLNWFEELKRAVPTSAPATPR